MFPAVPVVVETYSPRHHDGVVALVLAIQQQEFGVPITYDDQPDLQDPARFFSIGASRFFVAMAEQNEVIGTIGLLDIGDDIGVIRKMFVRADQRGPAGGVASALLDALLAHARAKGLHELVLGTTAAYLAAHRFYEKRGFAQIDRSELPPAFPHVAVDVRFYRLPLGG